MVECSHCGQQWPRDPAYEVACPVCKAQVGVPCKARRPSGHALSGKFSGQKLHPERDQLAMDLGFLQRCPKAPQAKPAKDRQRRMFA